MKRAIWTVVAIVLVLPILATVGVEADPAQSADSTSAGEVSAALTPRVYLPLAIMRSLAGPTLPPPVPYSAEPPLDFGAIEADLKSDGLELAYNKIGFHVATPCNCDGVGGYLQALDDAGVPFFIKGVDTEQGLYDAQQIAKDSDVPHTLVFRASTAGQSDGYDYDVPGYGYTQAPAEAAAEHWERHLAKFPANLDKDLVWLETVNEVDKDQSSWLAEFALETAKLALRDGYKWAAFGWSSGEPERHHWTSPAMLEFLRLVGEHPNQLAIALHEYSYNLNNMAQDYPYLLGRFQTLFELCDRYNIPRPTVLITEWGWTLNEVPSPEVALADIAWASWLYAAYPQVKGAAIWYLGPGFGNIGQNAQKLLAPVSDFSRSHYFGISPGIGRIDPSLFDPQNYPAAWLRPRSAFADNSNLYDLTLAGSGSRPGGRPLR